MKRFITNCTLFIWFVLATVSCQKTSSGGFVPDPPTQQGDTVWYPNDTVVPITASIDKPASIDSFNCISDDDGSKITIGDSVSITFPSGGCMTTPTYSPASTITSKNAKINATILVLTSKGDVIRHKIPTTSNGNLINFGAYVNIKLTYKKNPVYWNAALSKQIQIKVKTKDKYPLQPMQYFMFQPDTTNSKDTFWLPVKGHSQVSPTYVGSGLSNSPNNGYLFTSSKIGWFGCANLLAPSPFTTRVNAFLPINFTNKNTVVYAIFNDTKTVVRLKSNPAGKSYGATGIPIGLNITLVSISEINGQYFWGTSGTITASSSDPISITPYSVTDISVIDQNLRKL
jgi:hypothetical protein